MRPGGTVGVRIEAASGELRIHVSDDGPGMPAAAAAVLRGDRGAHSNAPALALIHEIVVAHGGRVEVRSSQDAFEHGTVVTIAVPLEPPRVR
jgi:signal transduction histidine kinase